MKKAKIILLILMALLAAVGLFVTFKPLMERAARQKQVDEANDSFIQQLEQIQSVQQDTPEATPYAQLREQIEQYNTWLYEGKQIALTNAAAYEQPACSYPRWISFRASLYPAISASLWFSGALF